jgi:prefoldin subunit 5
VSKESEIKQLEAKAQALSTQAQELNQKLQQVNVEFIKTTGAIEYLKSVKDE